MSTSTPAIGWSITAACLVIGLYQLAANWYGLLQPMLVTSVHLASMVFLAFLLQAERSDRSALARIADAGLACIAAASFLYTSVNFIDIQERGLFPNTADQVMAVTAILATLEATRRFYGPTLPIVAAVVLAYAMMGGLLPDGWQHSTWDLEFLTYNIYMGSDGLFGIAAKTSAVLIFTFVMLGAFLEKSGAMERIIEFSTHLTAPYAGGAAKVAVLASGLMGTVSGSSVANVTATGRFTIPLMISSGFRPSYAAGVEAVASTGGLLMPPIMGAGAFVMAEMLGISYWSIAMAALVPALLYYLVVFVCIHFEARRQGIVGLPREVKVSRAFARALPLLLPIVILIGFISMDVPPVRAALYTILFVILLALFVTRPLSPMLLVRALADGTRDAVPIACACACAGIIIGTLTGTGFAIKFSTMLLDLSQGEALLSLVLSMFVVIFLGMALPATASYLVGAAVVAVPLIKLGYDPLAVHLFVFYFANLAHITPPVDLATYAAASIARANPLNASVNALKIGLIAFLLPYVFVNAPELLLIEFEAKAFALAAGTAVAGALILGAGLSGWMVICLRPIPRVILIVCGVAMILPAWQWSFAAVGLASATWLTAYLRQPAEPGKPKQYVESSL